MTHYYTFSSGIAHASEVPQLLGNHVTKLSTLKALVHPVNSSDSVILGWGQKKNAVKARKYANKNKITFWNLEDGFISYLGHPALGDRRFSLIADKTGIYYDATQPSDIENLLNHPQWLNSELEARSRALLDTVCKHQISKYNHEPVQGFQLPESELTNKVLVVDQTYGDCSVKFGMADDSSFKSMLDAALNENPNSEVWVKVPILMWY